MQGYEKSTAVYECRVGAEAGAIGNGARAWGSRKAEQVEHVSRKPFSVNCWPGRFTVMLCVCAMSDDFATDAVHRLRDFGCVLSGKDEHDLDRVVAISKWVLAVAAQELVRESDGAPPSTSQRTSILQRRATQRARWHGVFCNKQVFKKPRFREALITLAMLPDPIALSRGKQRLAAGCAI